MISFHKCCYASHYRIVFLKFHIFCLCFFYILLLLQEEELVVVTGTPTTPLHHEDVEKEEVLIDRFIDKYFSKIRVKDYYNLTKFT